MDGLLEEIVEFPWVVLIYQNISIYGEQSYKAIVANLSRHMGILIFSPDLETLKGVVALHRQGMDNPELGKVIARLNLIGDSGCSLHLLDDGDIKTLKSRIESGPLKEKIHKQIAEKHRE